MRNDEDRYAMKIEKKLKEILQMITDWKLFFHLFVEILKEIEAQQYKKENIDIEIR